MNDSQHLEINDFVGIPWVKGGNTLSGADCWGLTTLALQELYNTKIDLFNGSKAKGDELSNIIESEIEKPRWKKVDIVNPGDVVVMYNKGNKKPTHIGVFIGGGNILHTMDEISCQSSSIHPVRILRRLFLRLEFYRYDNSNT